MLVPVKWSAEKAISKMIYSWLSGMLNDVMCWIPTSDVAGDYETIDSDTGESTDDDDGGGGGDGGAQHDSTYSSDDDADDKNDAEFPSTHQRLRGTFKTAEGITVTIVKGSVAAQKVCTSGYAKVYWL